ncbi:MAG TPA: response regulator, partial [Bacteroidia bacterium]
GENIPDVIMFDLNMPEMNGWEFIKQLNLIFEEENVHIPTFIFTSSIDPVDLERSYSFTDVKGYIPKPLTTIKLDKILRLIDSKELINNGSLKYYNYNQLNGN